VFAGVTDPIGASLVDSLARPGGNATGFMNYECSMASSFEVYAACTKLRAKTTRKWPIEVGGSGRYRRSRRPMRKARAGGPGKFMALRINSSGERWIAAKVSESYFRTVEENHDLRPSSPAHRAARHDRAHAD
jgi:hypothetical protein